MMQSLELNHRIDNIHVLLILNIAHALSNSAESAILVDIHIIWDFDTFNWLIHIEGNMEGARA